MVHSLFVSPLVTVQGKHKVTHLKANKAADMLDFAIKAYLWIVF